MKSEDSKKELFEGLQRTEIKAIQELMRLLLPRIKSYCVNYGLAINLAEEITNDSILELLKAIENKKFVFEGICPSAYCLRVGQYLIKNHSKSKYNQNSKKASIDDAILSVPSDEDIEKQLHENFLIKDLLEQIGEQCKKLIKLKYLEEYTYEQIIDAQLSHYQSVAALKNATQKCMAKMREIAKHYIN